MYRFFEIIPGLLTWATLAAMFIFSVYLPTAVAVFIILFDIYWLLKIFYLSFHLRTTFTEMRKNLKIDWIAELDKLKSKAKHSEHSDKLTVPDDLRLNWRDVYHLIILPTYREPYEVLRESFQSLAATKYPKDKMIVVLGTEERAGEETQRMAEKLKVEFGDGYFKFLVTVHPRDLPGEIPGKGSNETWAAKEVKRLVIDPLVNAQTNADYTQTNAEDEFLYKDLTYAIRGAIFSVKKRLSLGHKEIVYQKALEEEFMRLGLNFEKEKCVDVFYENKKVGVYRPDFVIEDKIILELKSLPYIGENETRQTWQYLKGSNYKLALLVNFGGNDIYIKRIVYDIARDPTFCLRKSALSQRKSAISYKDILVSVFDVDTQVYPHYFSRLTYVFLNAQHPYRSSFQPIPLFTNNVYQVPALARIVSFSSTFWQMMQQSRPERLTTFSSQSLPFQTLLDIGYWETDIVSEDSRVFWQCFLRYDGDFRVEPLLYPVSMDANDGPTFWQAMANLYRQQRRWAWGGENIPYMLTGFLKNAAISWRKKIYWTFNVIEGFHSWATNSLLIFALGWLPIFLGGERFNFTMLSYNLPQITRWIIQISMAGIVTSAIVSILLLPPREKEFRLWHYLLYFFQWALLPITLIVFGAIPAIEAQTRMALGGKFKLGFWVTPKHRK